VIFLQISVRLWRVWFLRCVHRWWVFSLGSSRTRGEGDFSPNLGEIVEGLVAQVCSSLL
jgi:hypothetical protein